MKSKHLLSTLALVFGLVSTTQITSAAITVTVVKFTASEMQLRFTGGETLQGPAPLTAFPNNLTIVDNSQFNSDWINGTITNQFAGTDTVTINGEALRPRIQSRFGFADIVWFFFNTAPDAGDAVDSDATVSVFASFNPENVEISDLAFYWGGSDQARTNGTFQSPVIDGTVPEPGTATAVMGTLAVVVCMVQRRVRRR